MASCFKSWLSDKLLSLNRDVDLDVFVSYITGILETDSPVDDKKDSLLDIIAEILPDDDITEHCSVIIDKWNELSVHDVEQQAASIVTGSIDSTIHSIIEQQTSIVPTTKAATASDATHKRAILAQYAEISDGEQTDSDADDNTGKPNTAAGSTDLLVKNVNALMVKERERSERDRAKQESESKRQKDKEDREKQKQKLQERKDNEKKRTQKGEKKR